MDEERTQYEEQTEHFCATHHTCNGVTVHRQGGKQRRSAGARVGRMWEQPLAQELKQKHGDGGMKNNISQVKAKRLEPMDEVVPSECEDRDWPVRAVTPRRKHRMPPVVVSKDLP